MSKIIKAKIILVAFFLIQVAVIANAQEVSDQDNPEEQKVEAFQVFDNLYYCLLYTSPSPRDLSTSRMPSSA